METQGLPPFAMPILIGIGFLLVLLLSISVGQLVIHMRDSKERGKTSLLGRWAWALSCIALVVPYIAPVTLVMGGVDLARQQNGDQPQYLLRPARLALLNSAAALVFLVAILGLFVFGWTK